MKTASFLMILSSFVRVMFGFPFLTTVAFANNMRMVSKLDLAIAWVTVGMIFAGGILELYSGLVGAINSEEPLLAGRCRKWAIITLIVTLISNALQIIQEYGASMVAWTTGLIVPGFFLIASIILGLKD